MMGFENKLDIGGNGPFLFKMGMWTLVLDVRNEIGEGMKFLNNGSW